MKSKTNKKFLIIGVNAVALILLLAIQINQLNKLAQFKPVNPEHQEIILNVTIMAHNQSTYEWIGYVCLGLLVINLFLYKQWVSAKRWILEPILIAVISYGLAFSVYTYRTLDIGKQVRQEQSE